ncbi:hypothetical protein TorRG33x02_064560, partial [Trema orientale]
KSKMSNYPSRKKKKLPHILTLYNPIINPINNHQNLKLEPKISNWQQLVPKKLNFHYLAELFLSNGAQPPKPTTSSPSKYSQNLSPHESSSPKLVLGSGRGKLIPRRLAISRKLQLELH